MIANDLIVLHNSFWSSNSQNKRRKSFFLFFLSVLFVVYISDSLLFATSNIRLLNVLRRIVPLACAALFFLMAKRIGKLLLIMSISIVFSMLLNFETDSYLFYITQIGYFAFAYYYCKKTSFADFFSMLLFIIRIIAILSLFGYFFSGFLKSVGFLPTITNVSGHTFKTLFFTNVPVDRNFSSLSRRNWGPFWEPGTFQFYLNIGIICTLFSKNRFWIFDTVLFSFALLTTLSGASILSLPFIFAAFSVHNDHQKNKWKWLIILFVFVGLIVLLSSGRFAEVLNKVMGESSESSSIGYRLGSLLGNLKATLHNPIFGVSSSYQQSLRAEATYSLNGVLYVGNVTTLLGYFSFFGIPIGLTICYLLFKTTHLFTANRFSRIMLFMAFVVMSSNENLMQSSLMCVLIFYGYVEGKMKKSPFIEEEYHK